MVTEEIRKAIDKTLKALKLPVVDFVVEHPADGRHGDFSTNVAMQLFSQRPASSVKRLGYKSPRELAEAIAEKLKVQSAKFKVIEKVEVAGPGFINFWLSEQFLMQEIARALDLGDKYGKSTVRRSEKVMVEFTDPNPFKEFHVGHLYSNIVGESLARLIEVNGATVKRANYQGDVGLHVAKALYGILEKLQVQSPSTSVGRPKSEVVEKRLKEREKGSLDERVKFLGEAYALGAKAFEEDKKAQVEIEKLNQQIYEKDSTIMDLYRKGRQWSLDYFEKIYERLGTKFDFYYFEREAGEIGLAVVKKNLERGAFEKSQGAVVFPGEKYGLHTRVFINSQGLPTYEAKDLGLAETKYKDFAYDQSIIVTGNEVDEYFRVVLKALNLINPKLGKKALHISHGMVRLPHGKISSRTGEVVTGEWLLDEAKRRVLEIIKKIGSLEKKPQEAVAEMVGVGAVKYALLKISIGRDLVFDFAESVSFEGNSGPYIQYTHARARSVLAKAKRPTFKGFSFKGGVLNAEEKAILRWLYRFPEVVVEAVKDYAPNKICEFLFELSQRYNAFYNKHPILHPERHLRGDVAPVAHLGGEYEATRDLRLALTAATAQIIRNGLYLLGIQAPEQM